MQVGVDACLQRLQPQLCQPRRLGEREHRRRHAGQRLAAPQRKARAQFPRPRHPIARLDRSDADVQQRLEALRVKLAGLQPDQVPGRYRADPVMGRVIQHRAQALHVVLQGHARRQRGCAAPEGPAEVVDRHHPAGAQQQGGEQCSLLPSRDMHVHAITANRKRSQHAILNRR